MALFVDMEKTCGRFHLKVQLEAERETLALLGASACGKSMTLKCIAGVEKPDRGRIVIDGVTVFDSQKKINLPPQKREVGLLFQNYALFPHMTVAQNIAAGAKRNGQERQNIAAETMEKFGLTEAADLYPRQLSGGQQQRTALARILVSAPRILLLDEPFSALDSHLRFRLEQELRQITDAFDGTVVMVSHDRNEVFRMADRIAVMEQGQITTVGTGETVFARPVTRSAAALTGCKNISSVMPVSANVVRSEQWGIDLRISGSTEGVDAVGIRLHSVRPGQGENSFRCRVTDVIQNPFSVTVMLQAAENAMPFGMEVSKETWKKVNDNYIYVNIGSEEILLLRDR